MSFARWLQEMWYLHTKEIEEWTGKIPEYSSQEYFQRNRWWLRNMYRVWQKRNDIK